MLQEYKEKPDYGRCVAIVASASLREMIKPGALAIVSPIAVGELSSVFALRPKLDSNSINEIAIHQTITKFGI